MMKFSSNYEIWPVVHLGSLTNNAKEHEPRTGWPEGFELTSGLQRLMFT